MIDIEASRLGLPHFTFNIVIILSVLVTESSIYALMTRFMGSTWDPTGADRTQVGPMLAQWTLLSGCLMTGYHTVFIINGLTLGNFMITDSYSNPNSKVSIASHFTKWLLSYMHSCFVRAEKLQTKLNDKTETLVLISIMVTTSLSLAAIEIYFQNTSNITHPRLDLNTDIHFSECERRDLQTP